jgi:outer membrane protein OmpA-like peptidoglycan-associated protein
MNMVDHSRIREHMEVLDSAGERVGTVDALDGGRIKLTRDGSANHQYVDLAYVTRVDDQVHLAKTRDALGLTAAAAAAKDAAGAAKPANPLPPLRNPAVDGARPRRNYMLPWVLAGLALLALIIALSQCDRDDHDTRRAADGAVPAVVTPRVAGAPLIPGTLAYDLNQFMSGTDGLPRTFTFGEINFDPGTANLRTDDVGDLNDIARVLAAYPDSRAAIVGYADARGDSRFNRDLGANRARAVIAALAARGVPAERLEARSGGEDRPAATNATPAGRFENRRTELVILER